MKPNKKKDRLEKNLRILFDVEKGKIFLIHSYHYEKVAPSVKK